MDLTKAATEAGIDTDEKAAAAMKQLASLVLADEKAKQRAALEAQAEDLAAQLAALRAQINAL